MGNKPISEMWVNFYCRHRIMIKKSQKGWFILNIFVVFENNVFRKYFEIPVMKNLGNNSYYIMRVSWFVQIMYCCCTSVLDPWGNVFYAGCFVSLKGIIWLCFICFIMSRMERS